MIINTENENWWLKNKNLEKVMKVRQVLCAKDDINSMSIEKLEKWMNNIEINKITFKQAFMITLLLKSKKPLLQRIKEAICSK